MNNTHRQSIGLELFFASRSGSFSGLSDYTPSDLEQLLGDNPLTRLYVGTDIYNSLQDYLHEECPAELLPEDIRPMCHSLSRCLKTDGIRRFMNWLMDIARRNETDRVRRGAALNAAAAGFGDPVASLIRTGLALNNQRVLIKRTGSTLSMSYAERDWGRVCVSFTGCTFGEDFPLEIPGYAFSTEAEPAENGLRFTLLIDSRFLEIDYSLRLMQPEGWHEFSFCCEDVRAEVTAFDYTARLEQLGTPRAELTERVCAALLSKHSLLGSGGMTYAEQAALPMAAFLSCGGTLLEKKKDQCWQEEQLILEALDNRYAMQRFGTLLEQCGCMELKKIFDTCTAARYDDDERTAISGTRRFAAAYDRLAAEGGARPLLKELYSRFSEMSGGFEGISPRRRAEIRAAECVRTAAEQQLRDAGFSGEYPHYRRRGKRCTEYLSFMIMPAGEAPARGAYSFYITLSAAKITDAAAKKLGLDDQTVGQANALDCHPEELAPTLYGELAGYDDGEFIRLDIPYRKRAVKAVNDCDLLSDYIRLALHQFRKERLPAGYSLRRLFHPPVPFPVVRHFFRRLPLCAAAVLALLVGYLLLTVPLDLPKLTPAQAFGGAAALCGGLTLAAALITRLREACRLWRR